ncbi:MAG TPA: prepilin peptidase [Planctomycetota bacterium]|nr:prepilin peptidase [Planctomycetota bacterium]
MNPQSIELLVPAFAFALGAIIGSFLNVVIYRLPRRAEGLSIASPTYSYCPKCGTTIRGYDNIPLLSYFLLGARCRACKVKIPIRYFCVELLTACLFAGIAIQHQPEWGVIAVYAGLTACLVSASFIDIDLTIIPDEISLPGIALAPLVSAAVPELHAPGDLAALGLAVADPRWAAAAASVAGILAGGLLIYAIGVLGKLAFRKEAMGFGDVKLFAMIGGYLGWKAVLLALFIACIAGALAGLVRLALTRESTIPFGPFLSIGAISVMLWRSEIVRFIFVDYPSYMRHA